jgi:hypothetical protein
MIVRTYLLAYREFELREVEIPDYLPDELEKAFLLKEIVRYGQNSVCWKNVPSLMIGDIIELDHYYLIATAGFKQISPEELEIHKKLSMTDRVKNTYLIKYDKLLHTIR